jgi:MFS family permease
LLLAAVVGGLGGNVQHPLASTMVARAYEGGRRATAIGTLNFAGDLGKVAAPALVTLTTVSLGWRTTLLVLGVFGLLFSLVVGLARAWVDPPRSAGGASSSPGPGAAGVSAMKGPYWLLATVGMLDATGRAAGLTFLPFGLAARGLNAGEISLVLGLVFAGGAVGKFVCGILGERLGPFAIVLVTEVAASIALLALLVSPLGLVFGLAVVFGFGLNGTSSVLYAAVAGLVPEGKRGRGYGLYYTATESAAALAPLLYGLLADRVGLSATFVVMAALTVAVIPLTSPLRRDLRV